MESRSSAFLHQISDLKHQIDQVNELIEAKTRGTRETELAIVQSLEKEQAAVSEAEKWQKILSRRESQLLDLETILDATKENIGEVAASIHLMEIKRDELCLEMEKERDSFIASCKSFQQEMDDRARNDSALIPLKFDLLREVESLKKDIKAASFSDEADTLSESKMERFRELQKTNAELQNELDAETAQNEHLLRRIEDLNGALVNVPGSQDISRLEEDFDLFTEEKRNLEDGIVTLHQQLPLLLSQEQKLSNLLRDQQRALQSLEQKIEEVKLLQEAYENDFEEQLRGETLANSSGTAHPQLNFTREEDVLMPAAQPPILYGTWDHYQTQPGKRHRVI